MEVKSYMNLLIVTPYFPPYSSVAVVRISSLTRYLLKQGVNITVLTNKLDPEYDLKDKDQELDNVNKVYVDIKKAKGSYFASRDLYLDEFHKLMKIRKFDCVFITSGPFYVLPLCKLAKQTYKTKCILDFRDLWVFDVRSKKEFFKPGNLFRKIIFYQIESQAIKYSDKVITVTDGWSEILKTSHPFRKKKMDVVYNGYDDVYLDKEIFSKNELKSNKHIEDGTFNIISFGKLSYYSKEYSELFFRAVNQLTKKYSQIRIVQIGSEESITVDIINKVGLNKGFYINTGFCDYKEGMDLLTKANICLLIDIRKQAIGTKIYDYLWVNKPILYVGRKDTMLSEFISSMEHGYSCQREEQVEKVISTIIDEKIDCLSSDNSSEKYSRSIQNKRFLEIIKNVINGG